MAVIPRSNAAQARELRAALQAAPDYAVGRVVAMLDGLNDRGMVDDMLVGVRPRLRRLQPPRPIRLARLLFLPLDGALVAPAAWKPGGFQVPRSAIQPVSHWVASGLGSLAAEVERAGHGQTLSNTTLVESLVGRLWPAAGALLARPAKGVLPPGWAEAGLPADAADAILTLCTAVWRHAVPLWQARLQRQAGPPEAALCEALTPLAAEGAAPLAVGMALLVRGASQPGQVASYATGLLPALGALAERELAVQLAAQATAVADSVDLAEMAGAASQLDRQLEDVEGHMASPTRESRRRLAERLRHEGGQDCHRRFAVAVVADLLVPAAVAAAGAAAEDAEVARLEAAARDLRRLEMAGRRLGQEAAFDATRRDAVMQLAALANTPGGLTRVELARLVEILAGPEAALPLLPG